MQEKTKSKKEWYILIFLIILTLGIVGTKEIYFSKLSSDYKQQLTDVASIQVKKINGECFIPVQNGYLKLSTINSIQYKKDSILLESNDSVGWLPSLEVLEQKIKECTDK